MLPRRAPATRILFIPIRRRLATDEPQPLRKKQRQQHGGNALRKIEAKAAKASEAMGHYAQWNFTSLNAHPLRLRCILCLKPGSDALALAPNTRKPPNGAAFLRLERGKLLVEDGSDGVV
jgi:hypothetical protein